MIDQDRSSASHDSTTHPQQESPTHQDFHWINSELQGTLYGQLLETTLDVSAGIHTCLQIVYASDLERAGNEDADMSAPPAVGILQADQLMRLAIASAGLLRDEARRQVELHQEVDAAV
ncbi:hypothetical protein FHW67_003107 [Herbaspirillum sp. Sphag1AN]|uniref:hypothetical protein n=1 Tax=unclassified Herbaspirillum TaxID=2624150 RepID=UPI0016166886|nr:MULTISPECIES: hypothetical protein [unclassified Herbaspirillum]MBB3213806.1 hypothetical protein [Herbaspirillum sp. Sphag1AN]MBB3247003.1 hypothetical protein [Herbaspirillum sp. Sphag64]